MQAKVSEYPVLGQTLRFFISLGLWIIAKVSMIFWISHSGTVYISYYTVLSDIFKMIQKPGFKIKRWTRDDRLEFYLALYFRLDALNNLEHGAFYFNPGFHLWRLHLLSKRLTPHEHQRGEKSGKIGQSHCTSTCHKQNISLECPKNRNKSGVPDNQTLNRSAKEKNNWLKKIC